MRRRNRRWTALAGAALVAVTQLTVLLAGATPASAAVSGVERNWDHSEMSSNPVKIAQAYCPFGYKVLGGGGAVEHDAGSPTTEPEKVVLTTLRPGADSSGRHYYRVSAEAIPGYDGVWRVGAYAICAPASSVPGNYQILGTFTGYDSQSVKVATVVCPGNTRVLGSGAEIQGGNRQVTLQVARPSGPGDITRSQAREDADGYSGTWQLIGYAVCANPPSGYQVIFRSSLQKKSETHKHAWAYCPEDQQLLDAGGAMTDSAPGGTALRSVFPGRDDRYQYAAVTASESTSTGQVWDSIVATAICVNG